MKLKVNIKEYDVVNQENHRFTAKFEYQDAQYQLNGLMEKEEFNKIIEKFKIL